MITRRWKFVVETDEGSGYLLASGDLVHDPDAAENWIGTDLQADAEAERRVAAFEERIGVPVNRIVYESQGKVMP